MTERDVVLRERAAFVAGWFAYQDPATKGNCHNEAAKRYPLPKITRPRVAQDHTGPTGLAEWRVVDGCIEWRRTSGNEWKRTDNDSGSGMYINVERVKMLADLLANPNETVEDA